MTANAMNGAESLVRTFVSGGLNVCFANPGTSEMHFVSALDRVDGMRCVLGLFEGVVSGAADGYYRMSRKPASTLLHLGPGLSNASANLHNAKKAMSGMVNVIGQHATYHVGYNAPLTSDIEGLARPISDWVLTSPDSKSIARDGAAAITAAASPPGKIASLILPADTAWNPSEGVAEVAPPQARKIVSAATIDEAARWLKNGEPTLLLISHQALDEQGLDLAARIGGKTGARVMAQTFNPRMARGAGRYAIERIPYVIEVALPILAEFRQIITVHAADPVAFFAYPNKPSLLKPEGCKVHTLVEVDEDAIAALEALADAVGAKASDRPAQSHPMPDRPQGQLTFASIAAALANGIPEGAIVVDESITSGRTFFPPTAGAAPHDWLQNLGGSIGFSPCVAIGAAVACPDRPVICMTGDGSFMYTNQALWTQAREGLNITTVIFANRRYQILQGEFKGVEAGEPGAKARDMLRLDDPTIDFVALAKSMGVPAVSVDTADGLLAALERGVRTPGPKLIEVVFQS